LSSAAAIQAGKLIRKVLVIDPKFRLGGVSVYTGTIPSKTLRETVLNPTGWRDRSFNGYLCRVKDAIPAEDLKARLNKTLDYEVDAFNRMPIPDEFRVSHPAEKDQK
jgi:NAD(P) transhydrogenase